MWSCQNSTVESGLLNSLSIARPITKKVFSKKKCWGGKKKDARPQKYFVYLPLITYSDSVSLGLAKAEEHCLANEDKHLPYFQRLA
jgi:hypothetical protein